MLDRQYQQGRSWCIGKGNERLSSLQWRDTEYRPSVLPEYRNQASYLPWQATASAFYWTRRDKYTWILSERVFFKHATGGSIRGTETDSRFQKPCYLPSGLCHRIRLFWPYPVESFFGIQESKRSVSGRTSQRNHRIWGGCGSGTGSRHQCSLYDSG